MSVGLVFHIGDPEDTIFSDHFVWRDLVFCFDLDFYIIADYTKGHNRKNYSDDYKESYVVRDLKEIRKIKPNHKLIYVSQGGEDLKTFNHPKENVIYIVGKDFGRDLNDQTSPTQDIEADIKLGIYYPNQKREIWGIHAASIVLYDRLIKL